MSADVDGCQRAAFRMQLDPAFAARILDGDVAAIASTGLGPREIAWLRATDRAAWLAEPRRREQVIGNIAGEFALTAALAPKVRLDRFLGTDGMHAAIAGDRSLPLAFAEWLVPLVPPSARPVATLEAEMARARRLQDPRPDAEIRLARGARMVTLPGGTVAYAADLRVALDARASPPPRPVARPDALVVLAPRPTRRWTLPEVAVEEVGGAVAAVILASRDGIRRADFAVLAAAWEAGPGDVERVVDELVADGYLETNAPIG